MRHYLSLKDIDSLNDWVAEARDLKKTHLLPKNWGEIKRSVYFFSTTVLEHV